jgi:outer membrane protein assembly factor BamB
MRRLLIILAAVAVLLGGAVAAVVIHRLHQGRDIVGSPTVEFTQTVAAIPPPLRRAAIVWPQYGLVPQRTRAVDLPLRPPFRTVWTYRAGSLVEFPPVIGFGRLYLSTNSGKLAAISIRTGKRAWKRIVPRCVAASPGLGRQGYGTVFAVFLNRPPCNADKGGHGRDGLLLALSAGSGRLRWSRRIGPSESSPLLYGHRLYVGDWNGDVWAMYAGNGKVIWRRRVGGQVKGALAVVGHRLYVGAYDGHVYCLDLATGRIRWRAAAQARLYGASHFYATPAVAYGRVYIGSTDGKVYSYGAASGKLRWSRSTGGYVYASPAVWKGVVYVGSYSHRFYALDAATGRVRWRFEANGPISGSPTVIGDVVYFATLTGRTYALDARTGRQVWTFPDGKYTPAVAMRGRFFLIGYTRIYGMVPR